MTRAGDEPYRAAYGASSVGGMSRGAGRCVGEHTCCSPAWSRQPRAPTLEPPVHSEKNAGAGDHSIFQVPALLQELPVGEVSAEGKAPVLGKAEDVELRVVLELGATPFPKVRLYDAQVLGLEIQRVCIKVGKLVVIHGTSCPDKFTASEILVQVLCAQEDLKIRW